MVLVDGCGMVQIWVHPHNLSTTQHMVAHDYHQGVDAPRYQHSNHIPMVFDWCVCVTSWSHLVAMYIILKRPHDNKKLGFVLITPTFSTSSQEVSALVGWLTRT